MYRVNQLISRITHYSIHRSTAKSINCTILSSLSHSHTSPLRIISTTQISTIQPTVTYSTAYIPFNELSNLLIDDNDDEGT
jgi:hypothetical protein